MHIDFAPPSGGTYNNAGSSRQLTSYMEHEDLERMEKGIYTDDFFNLTDDNIYKSKVIKDIDTNIGQLLKTDAKFFAIHVSPSESELRAMGNTEQEQAEAMKRYVREVFIPEYAKNFNKGLSEPDIKFYGKIHFDRSRSNNELNMHCHLIVSRKDQTGKKKLSPLINHKNTKNGVIKGGFDRVNLFRQAEQGFDKLFSYNRQLSESFEYSNTMKNGSIDDKLRMQEQELKEPKQYFTGEKKKDVFQSSEKENNISCNLDNNQNNEQSFNQANNKTGDSLLSIFSLGDSNGITGKEAQKEKEGRNKAMIEYEEPKNDIDRYLMERFKYRRSLVYLTVDNVITTRRNSRIDLYLRIRKVKSLFPPDCLIIVRLGFSKEQTGHGTHFVRFLTGIALKYGFRYVGIECANSKSSAFAKKLGFYSIDGENLAITVSNLMFYFSME